MSIFTPYSGLPGGYSVTDGTIDFYSRVKTLINENMTVLDLGAGRAEWYEDDKIPHRKNTRLLKGHVKEVVAADVDKVVLTNRCSDRQIIIENNTIPLEDNSVDLIVCDYVFEHVVSPEEFAWEINRVLKTNGWLCARTPHKYNYVSIIARIIKNSKHASILKLVQPFRKEVDVFPTTYKLNELRQINKIFDNYSKYSFLYKTDPDYYFGKKTVYYFFKFLLHIMPKFLSANIFVFLRKN